MATKDVVNYMRRLVQGAEAKLGAPFVKSADAPDLDSEHPVASADAGTQEAQEGFFYDETEERMKDVGEQTPGEEPELGPARDSEEMPEGHTLVYGGEADLPSPERPPTEKAKSPEEMDEIKNASVSQLVKAANDLMLRLAAQLASMSGDDAKTVANLAPGFLTKSAMETAKQAAERQADLIVATLKEIVKMAAEAVNEESAETEASLDAEDVALLDDLVDDALRELSSQGVDLSNLDEKELDELAEAIADGIVDGLEESMEEPPEGESKAEETEEDEEEEKAEEADTSESEGSEQLLRALSEAPAPAEAAQAIADASDQDLINAAIDATKSASISWEKLAASGDVGRVLVNYMLDQMQRGRYRPISSLPAEKRAKAQRLRDYMELFLSELVQTNSK